MNPRLLAYAGLVLGGGLGLVASGQPWWRAVGQGVRVGFTGTATTAGLTQALGVVVLVGALLLIVLHTRGRRVLGVLLTIVGTGQLITGVLRPRPGTEAVRSQVREVSLADQFALQGTSWPLGYAAAGALVMAGGVICVRTAHRWAARPDRFTRMDPATGQAAPEDDPAELWRAQDRGQDPTRERNDPDVRPGDSGDTMGEEAKEAPATPRAE